MICFLCNSPATHKAVINGIFGSYCYTCIKDDHRSPDSGHASYSRQKDFEDHRADTIQPRFKNGRPNPEFVKFYPEESKSEFTIEELKEIS